MTIPVLAPSAVGTSLSEYEIDLCQELAGVIWQENLVGTTGFGVATSLTELTLLKTKLRAYVSALDSSACSAVRECLSLWLTVRFGSIELRDADIGCLHGVNFSSDNARKQIKDIFLLYVPVYQMGELSDKRDKALMPGQDSYIRMVS